MQVAETFQSMCALLRPQGMPHFPSSNSHLQLNLAAIYKNHPTLSQKSDNQAGLARGPEMAGASSY